MPSPLLLFQIIFQTQNEFNMDNKSTEKQILTPREQEVALFILKYKFEQNLNLIEISERLHISINTLKTHRNHIYKKLDIQNIIQLKKAQEARLF